MREIFVRIDTGAGRGHHQHVRTAGAHSKFGVPLAELEAFARLARERRRAHRRPAGARRAAAFSMSTTGSTARQLRRRSRSISPTCTVIDVGGGLGVPERAGQPGVDLEKLDTLLAAVRAEHPQLEFWIEPGRYLVAAAGVLLARVTQLKSKGEVRYVGIATGMNSLIRPALYGAYHEIVNLTRADEPADRAGQHRGPDLRERGCARARPAAAADPRRRRAADRQCRRLWRCHELALQSARAGGGAVHLKRWRAADAVRRASFLARRRSLGVRWRSLYVRLPRSAWSRTSFEGRRWTLPAQVYAAPLELYAGLPLSLADLEHELAAPAVPPRRPARAPGHLSAAGRSPRCCAARRALRRRDRARLAAERRRPGRRRSSRCATAPARTLPILRLEPLLIGSIFPIHGEDRIVVTPAGGAAAAAAPH